jgi:Uma2 family endonuclease
MTTAPAQPNTTAAPPQFERYVTTRLPVRRFSVEEYHRLISQGYFASDERFELLEGWIVAKVPRNPVHDAAVQIANDLLRDLVPGGWGVRCQLALTTSDSEPEPDVVVARGQPRDYVSRHPGPGDVALVVEVANTSLFDDREIKGRVYARAGVSVYWIVNLIDRQVEVYTDPTGPVSDPIYRRRDDYRSGQLVPLSIAGTSRQVPVDELLP